MRFSLSEIMPAAGWSTFGGRKYWVIFKNSMQTALAHRFNTFTSLISEALVFVVMAYLWLSIYYQGNKIGDYTLKGLIIYYLLTRFISLTIKSGDTGRIVGDAIRNGEISQYLVKPLSFLGENFAANLGVIFYRVFIYAIVFLAIILFGFKTNFPAPAVFIYFFLSIAMAVAINFLIFYMVGISTFYFGFVQGFNFNASIIASLFSGNFIPLDILPPYLLSIANYLPFKFIAFIPVSIITGKISLDNAPIILLSGFAWVIILYLSSIILLIWP
mgnify:CR=1 FL=1